MLTLWAIRPVSNSMIEGNPTPAATVSSVRRCAISSTSCATSASESDTSVLISSRVSSLPSWSVAEAIFVPPTSSPMYRPFTGGSSDGSARARAGRRRMPGKDAGRVPGRSPCPDRGRRQAPAAPVRVRGDPSEGPLEAARRGLVEEDAQRSLGRAHAPGRRLGVRRLGERAGDGGGLVGTGDEEVDVAGGVEDGEGERHAWDLRLHPRDRDGDREAPDLVELRLAGEQRGGVAVGAHAQQHEVEARVRAQLLAQRRLVSAGGGVGAEL